MKHIKVKEAYEKWKSQRGISLDAIIRQAELDRRTVDELMLEAFSAGAALSTEDVKRLATADAWRSIDEMFANLNRVFLEPPAGGVGELIDAIVLVINGVKK